ncbi:MAG: acetyl-CoA carboxylase biotin carboxyl carrier protein [Planctomycetota bacterium]|jgi:acetyl-CoA carboxylase biotin carboxyl carrier protein
MAAKRSQSKKSTPPKKSAAKRAPAKPEKAAAKKKAAKKATTKKATVKKAPAKKAPAKRAPAKRRSAGDERLAQLESLVEMMVAKDVVEVELEEAGARWRVRRTEPQAVTYAAPAMAMPAAAGVAAPAPGAAPAAAAPAEPQGEVFKSPMLGTYYAASSPDSESFCKAGDHVNPDTTLCIIEAMKVMNEIKAEQSFEILEVLVKNGEPVEYGQPMFLIR